jgi:putative thioredoxin
MASETVVEASDATFQSDVIEPSHELPVVVDFWAPWCGPCRVLGPTIEGIANELEGQVRLVKVNTDENPQVAAAFQISSIPAVKAFKDGQVVDEFIGALPAPQVREFFGRVVPSEADRLAGEGDWALEQGHMETAKRCYEQALDLDAANVPASIGLAEVLLAEGDTGRAGELAGRAPADPRARRMLARFSFHRAAEGADRAALEARLAADPGDAAAHYALGNLLASQEEWEPALDHLIQTVMRDRKLDDDGGRKRVLDILELLGDGHELTSEYRQRLTNVLF